VCSDSEWVIHESPARICGLSSWRNRRQRRRWCTTGMTERLGHGGDARSTVVRHGPDLISDWGHTQQRPQDSAVLGVSIGWVVQACWLGSTGWTR
jgi:hypothetical protein